MAPQLFVSINFNVLETFLLLLMSRHVKWVALSHKFDITVWVVNQVFTAFVFILSGVILSCLCSTLDNVLSLYCEGESQHRWEAFPIRPWRAHIFYTFIVTMLPSVRGECEGVHKREKGNTSDESAFSFDFMDRCGIKLSLDLKISSKAGLISYISGRELLNLSWLLSRSFSKPHLEVKSV